MYMNMCAIPYLNESFQKFGKKKIWVTVIKKSGIFTTGPMNSRCRSINLHFLYTIIYKIITFLFYYIIYIIIYIILFFLLCYIIILFIIFFCNGIQDLHKILKCLWNFQYVKLKRDLEKSYCVIYSMYLYSNIHRKNSILSWTVGKICFIIVHHIILVQNLEEFSSLKINLVQSSSLKSDYS